MDTNEAILSAINELKTQLPNASGPTAAASQPTQPVTATAPNGQAGTPQPGASPTFSPQTGEPSPEMIAQVVSRLTGGRTTDPNELKLYIQNADAVMQSVVEAERAKQAATQGAKVDEDLADTIGREFAKQGTAQKGLAWLFKEAVAAAAQVSDANLSKREQAKAESQARSHQGRVLFFQDNPDLLDHVDAVDKLVSKGMDPREAGDTVRSLVKSGGGSKEKTEAPTTEVGIPGLTKQQIEQALRTGSASTPAVRDHQQSFRDSDARKKVIDEISAKIDSAETSDDVWAAIAKYKAK